MSAVTRPIRVWVPAGGTQRRQRPITEYLDMSKQDYGAHAMCLRAGVICARQVLKPCFTRGNEVAGSCKSNFMQNLHISCTTTRDTMSRDTSDVSALFARPPRSMEDTQGRRDRAL